LQKTICEQSPRETTIYFQSVYYNDTVSSNHWSIYRKSQHVRTEYGGRRREGEREKWISRERQSVGQKWKWRGSEMAAREIENLSIFKSANQ
jgi:hypothetical protein